MGFVQERKILTIGESLAVTLPSDWLKYNKLKAGDILELDFDMDSVRVRVSRKK